MKKIKQVDAVAGFRGKVIKYMAFYLNVRNCPWKHWEKKFQPKERANAKSQKWICCHE